MVNVFTISVYVMAPKSSQTTKALHLRGNPTETYIDRRRKEHLAHFLGVGFNRLCSGALLDPKY